jgi:hypothetical protein
MHLFVFVLGSHCDLYFRLLSAKEEGMARRSKAKKRPASKAKTTKRAHIVARPEKLARAFAAGAAEDIELAWGKKVSPAFKRRVIEISAELGMDPNNLMAAIAFESARTFRADIENPLSGAVGLIQFMPATAKGAWNIDDRLEENDAGCPTRVCQTLFLGAEGQAQ